MDSFKEKLLRLKNELHLEDDKDIAEVLGLNVKAFSARKARGSFPEKELFALKAKRPDLDLDTDYILLGIRQNFDVFREIHKPRWKFEPSQGEPSLSFVEEELLRYFRFCNDKTQEVILNVAKGMATAQMLSDTKFSQDEKSQKNLTSKVTIHGNVEQQNNIEHLEGGIHFKKGK